MEIAVLISVISYFLVNIRIMNKHTLPSSGFSEKTLLLFFGIPIVIITVVKWWIDSNKY
jgi:hypothetical protein